MKKTNIRKLSSVLSGLIVSSMFVGNFSVAMNNKIGSEVGVESVGGNENYVRIPLVSKEGKESTIVLKINAAQKRSLTQSIVSILGMRINGISSQLCAQKAYIYGFFERSLPKELTKESITNNDMLAVINDAYSIGLKDRREGANQLRVTFTSSNKKELGKTIVKLVLDNLVVQAAKKDPGILERVKTYFVGRTLSTEERELINKLEKAFPYVQDVIKDYEPDVAILKDFAALLKATDGGIEKAVCQITGVAINGGIWNVADALLNYRYLLGLGLATYWLLK